MPLCRDNNGGLKKPCAKHARLHIEEMKNKSKKMTENIRKICLGAVFAALCAAATFVSVPLPFGYFNLGDVMVLTSAMLLGPFFGSISAGIGSAVADIIMGYAAYAPATFIIKGAVAIIFALLHKLSKKLFGGRLDVPAKLLCSVISESVMVGGYFAFEALVMGYGAGALASVPGNIMQALSCSLLFTLLSFLLRKTKLEKLF